VGPHSGVVAGAAVAAAAVQFVVAQTIPVATCVTPPAEGGAPPTAVDVDGGRGAGGVGQAARGVVRVRVVTPLASTWGC